MSGDKRWFVDPDGDLEWSTGPLAYNCEWVMQGDVAVEGNLSAEAHAALVAAVADAARLRSLAATFDLNRDKTYTGAQVAAMLRDGGE